MSMLPPLHGGVARGVVVVAVCGGGGNCHGFCRPGGISSGVHIGTGARQGIVEQEIVNGQIITKIANCPVGQEIDPSGKVGLEE